jgi:hypothetical protein
LNAPLPSTPAARLAAGSTLVAVLLVAALFGLAAATDALWPDDELPLVQPAVDHGAVMEARDRARLRCDTCGVISAIRAVPGSDGTPAGYEFSVRLADGSIRVTPSLAQNDWRVGDRIRLMGGAGSRPPAVAAP